MSTQELYDRIRPFFASCCKPATPSSLSPPTSPLPTLAQPNSACSGNLLEVNSMRWSNVVSMILTVRLKGLACHWWHCIYLGPIFCASDAWIVSWRICMVIVTTICFPIHWIIKFLTQLLLVTIPGVKMLRSSALISDQTVFASFACWVTWLREILKRNSWIEDKAKSEDTRRTMSCDHRLSSPHRHN